MGVALKTAKARIIINSSILAQKIDVGRMAYYWTHSLNKKIRTD
jgi:hypothetical protein